jgi:thiol-disulfide isomerase/thioredoxin
MGKGSLSVKTGFLPVIIAAVLTCFVPSLALSGTLIEGQPAPGFVLPGLLDAETQSLSDLKGKVVLLNIWASWCMGCREEMEDLMSVQEHYGPRGLAVVAVNIDNTSSRAVTFMKDLEQRSKKKTGMILLFDKDKTVSKDYRQRAMPTSYLINREGTLKKIYPGSFTKESIGALKTALEEVLQ